jgi:hypothetical protein
MLLHHTCLFEWKLAVNNFLCRYLIKLFSPLIVCKHNFPEIDEVNLRTLTKRHVWCNNIPESVNKLIFHIIPFISPRSYIIPWAYRFSGWYHDLELINGMIWKMPCNNLYISDSNWQDTFKWIYLQIFNTFMKTYRK